MTLSDLIVEYLEQCGVEYVFGVPGSPLGPLFDALARSERRGGPRMILTRHESGAAFMADGYARESGKIGVCCSTTGPGATNLITGVASAHAERVPLLAITAQTRLPNFSFGCFQDSSRDGVDIIGMFSHCTAYNSIITHPNQLETKLAAALTIALGVPGGASHLSIPVDIFGAESPSPLSFRGLSSLLSTPDASMDNAAFDRLIEELKTTLDSGGKIAILAGYNAIGAGDEITRLAELTGACIVTTPRGKSAINPYHPLSRGVFGCSGHSSARDALAAKDIRLILAVGSNLGEWATSGWDPVIMNDRLIHIDDDQRNFKRSPMARLRLRGAIKTVFQRLVNRMEESGRSGDVSQVYNKPLSTDKNYIPSGITTLNPGLCAPPEKGHLIKAPQIYRELIRQFPSETRFFIDNSNSVPWCIHYFFHERPEALLFSIEFASMAWAVGASVGGAFANPQTPSVCIAGDGCYLMSSQEITVAVEHCLPVVFVVLNDHGYGLIRHGHRIKGSEPVSFNIPEVDFAMMARAAGAQGFTIRDSADLENIDWRDIMTRRGPTLLDVRIDPDESPPLAMA